MFVGAGSACLFLDRMEVYIPYILVFAASSFIYVAMSDLIPALNRRVGIKALISQILLISIGLSITSMIGIRIPDRGYAKGPSPSAEVAHAHGCLNSL